MKKQLFIWPLLVATMLFVGCKERLNVDDIDTTAQVKLGVAVPVGMTSATLGDFLGKGQVSNLFVGCDGDTNLFYFKDTFSITRIYHDVDLKRYISNVRDTFGIYEKIKDDPRVSDHKITTSTYPEPFHLDFPMHFKLKKVNEPGSDERMDSAYITDAEFTSYITVTQGFQNTMPWDWIDSVFILLGKDDNDDSFRRDGGRRLNVYRRGDSSGATNYGKNIPITVDEFTINLMKNKDLQPGMNNVRRDVDFHIEFHFTIPANQPDVYIPDDAAFDYNLQVEFMHYKAVWGWFKPSADMRDTHRYTIADEWSPWGDMKKAKLPFYNPVVDLYIKTQVAGAMVLHGDELYVKTEGASDSTFANFAPQEQDFQKTREEHFEEEGLDGYGYLDPIDSEIGDTARYYVLFNKDLDKGRIDKLFAVRPDIIGYRFHIDFDSLKTPQIRVTPNTKLYVDAVITLPFTLNQDYGINWSDTLKGIDISKYTIDSLMTNVKGIDTIKTANVKLFVTAINEIPLDFYADIHFLDSLGRVIMDPLNPTDTFRVTESRQVRINMPNYKGAKSAVLVEPGETLFVINVNKEQTDALTAIRSMVYNVTADDATLQASHYADYPVALRTTQKLKVHVGVAGTVEGIFDIMKLIKGEDQKK